MVLLIWVKYADESFNKHLDVIKIVLCSPKKLAGNDV